MKYGLWVREGTAAGNVQDFRRVEPPPRSFCTRSMPLLVARKPRLESALLHAEAMPIAQLVVTHEACGGGNEASCDAARPASRNEKLRMRCPLNLRHLGGLLVARCKRASAHSSIERGALWSHARTTPANKVISRLQLPHAARRRHTTLCNV